MEPNFAVHPRFQAVGILHRPLRNLQPTGQPQLLGQKDNSSVNPPCGQFKRSGDLFHGLAVQKSGDNVSFARG